MKTLLVAVLLLCAAPVYADTCSPDCIGPVTDTSLKGTVKSPGDTFTYDFFVETFSNNGQGEAILNGTLLAKGKNAGLTTFSADYFFFPVAGSDVLVHFGNWNLVATVGTAYVVDPPVATPEPSTLLLLIMPAVFFLVRQSKRAV